MNFFSKLFDKIINLAKNKNSEKYLYFVSFIESFIFPVPPDVLLAPIALTKKIHWAKVAVYTTFYSVLGGIIGYILGIYLFEINFFQKFVNENYFFEAKNLFIEHGFIIIFIAGFTPIPYKVFAITAGYMSVAFFPFVFASFIGRGLRFFCVAALFYYFGFNLATKLKKYFEHIGFVIIIVFVYFIISKYF
jgi:membrane protein YqaA with SNARE-associated domain